MSIRHLLRRLALASAVFAAAPQAGAFPDKTVTIVVGAAPGAGGDLIARFVAQRLQETWKQPVIVENRTGANGLLASNQVLQAAADGHTIYVANDSTATNQVVLKRPPFDPRLVFAPISLLATNDLKLVARPSLPVKSIPELIAFGREHPGKLNFASSGVNTPHHLMGELFRVRAGIEVLHIPYKGTAPAVTDVITGNADYAFAGFPAVDQQIVAGNLRALATVGDKRNSDTPDLPTIAETLPGFSTVTWWSMLVRKEVPTAIQSQIYRDVISILNDPDIRSRLKKGGVDTVAGTPADLLAYTEAEIRKWESLPPGVILKQ